MKSIREIALKGPAARSAKEVEAAASPPLASSERSGQSTPEGLPAVASRNGVSSPIKPAHEGDFEAHELAHADSTPDLAPIVGTNLRRLRVRRGLSLERLSKASGVSRAMLSQIELGQSAPSINVLWKIAKGLDLPFSALISNRSVSGTQVLRVTEAKRLTSHDGTFTSRALFPFDEPRKVEFYELKLGPGSVESAHPHPAGTAENLIVTHGTIEMEIQQERHVLSTGDAILFEADVPHAYRNPSTTEQATMYLVMTYADTIG